MPRNVQCATRYNENIAQYEKIYIMINANSNCANIKIYNKQGRKQHNFHYYTIRKIS